MSFNSVELIGFLNEKITSLNGLAAGNEINEVNICRHEPGEIPGLAGIPSTHTWHVISPVEIEKGKCGRTKRSTKTGRWKVNGNPCVVKDVYGKKIGFKRYLTFEEKEILSSASSSSSANQASKYIWKIHEFHSSIRHRKKNDYVLCKLMKEARTSRDNAVADTAPMATELPPIITPEPITAAFQTQNDNFFVEGFGEDYYIPQFEGTDWWIDPSQGLFDGTFMQDLNLDDSSWNM